jgi:GAF domain-containing protein
VNISAGPLISQEGVLRGGVIVCSDITARKQAEKEIERHSKALAEQNWLKTGQAELNERMRGHPGITELGMNVIAYLTQYLNAQVGVIYATEGADALKLIGTYACTACDGISERFKLGEGLVGQAAAEKRRIRVANAPRDYVVLASGLIEASLRNILVTPLLYEDTVKGVLEFAAFSNFTALQLELVDLVAESIAVAIHTAQIRAQIWNE